MGHRGKGRERWGGEYFAAARLCEMLSENYSGMELTECYQDVAGHFESVVGVANNDVQAQVLAALAELKKVEPEKV